MPNNNRPERTENAYRNQMREALISLLKIMNPQDQIEYSSLTYPALVKYALGWLTTENVEVSAAKEELRLSL